MIKKIGAILAIIIGASLFAPAELHAASNSKKKVAVLKKQLKKLDNAGTSFSKVSALVKKLAKLDPKKASTYLQAGLKKLDPVAAEQSAALASSITNIVKQSGLSEKEVAKLEKKIEKVEEKFVAPVPTPTPYVAAVLSGVVLA